MEYIVEYLTYRIENCKDNERLTIEEIKTIAEINSKRHKDDIKFFEYLYQELKDAEDRYNKTKNMFLRNRAFILRGIEFELRSKRDLMEVY